MGIVITQSDTSKPKGERVMGNPEPSAKASAKHAVQRVDVGRLFAERRMA